MTAAAGGEDDREMNERSPTTDFCPSRRRVLALGAGFAAGALVGPFAAPGRRGAAPRRHPGQRPADADRAAGLSRRRAARSGRGAQHDADHHRRTCSARGCSLRSTRPPISSGFRTSTPSRFPDWRTINAQALVTGRLAQADGRLTARVPPVGRVRRPATRRQAVQHHAGQLAPHRAHHLGCDLRAAHRREGLLRQPRRLCRRVRPEGPPGQAAGDHGPGRRQRALSHARRRSRAHAALLVVARHHHLHVVRPGRPQGLS